MNVSDPNLVIVRGINSEWLSRNFAEMWIGFHHPPIGVPIRDAKYIGLYLEAPISAITHIGIVESIDRYDGVADFYLSAIVKLKKPVTTTHQIRKHEYWSLADLGISAIELNVKPIETKA